MKKMIKKLSVIMALMMVLTIFPGNVKADSLNILGPYPVTLEMDKTYTYQDLLNNLVGNGAGNHPGLTLLPGNGTEDPTGVITYDNQAGTLTTNGASFIGRSLIFAIENGTTVYQLKVTFLYSSNDFIVVNPYASTNIQVGDQDKTLTYMLARPITYGMVDYASYVSSNSSVLRVDANGLLHAVAPGHATISATLHYGQGDELMKIIDYTVSAATPSQPSAQPAVQPSTQPVTQTATGDVTLDTTTMELKTGETDKLTAVCDSAVTWSSSDTSIATVDSQGNVTAVAPGSATITCSTSSDSAACTVTVSAWTASWNVSNSTLQVGKKTTVIQPVLEDGDSVQSYTSSNPKVATINSTGKISALKAGTTVLNVTTTNGATASMNLTCKKGKVLIKTITVLTTLLSLKVKDTYTINAVVAPISSSEKLSYESSNKKIAKVSSTGKITAKKAGKCTILVKSQNKVKKIKVTVTK